MSIVLRTYKGDSAPPITFTITRQGAGVVDLTGATVRLVIKDPRTGKITNSPNPSSGIDNICDIVGQATNGICTYTWNLGGTDLPDAGRFPAEIKIYYGNNTVETYGLTIWAESVIS